MTTSAIAFVPLRDAFLCINCEVIGNSKHPVRFKHGAVIRKSNVAEWGKDLGMQPNLDCHKISNWFVDKDTPVFIKDRDYLRGMIPRHWEEKP